MSGHRTPQQRRSRKMVAVTLSDEARETLSEMVRHGMPSKSAAVEYLLACWRAEMQ